MPTLKYCKTAEGNFGDDLNLTLWNSFFPELTSYRKDVHLYGIGTLLGGKSKVHPTGTKVVLGSGFGYKRPIKLSTDWKFYWVRGPLTAQKLGLEPKLALTDPAILWPNLKKTKSPSKTKVGIAPHFKTLSEYDWSDICERCNLTLIDPRQSADKVAEKIASCESVLAESLHAAIFADALRVPWVPIVLSHRFNLFKWRDWTSSIEVAFESAMLSHYPHHHAATFAHQSKAKIYQCLGAVGAISPQHGLRPIKGSSARQIDLVVKELTALRNGARKFSLSQDDTLERHKQEMLSRCSQFAADFGIEFNPSTHQLTSN